MSRYYEGKAYDDPEEALADAQDIVEQAIQDEDQKRIVWVDDMSGKRKMAYRDIPRGAVVGVLRNAETAEFSDNSNDSDNRFQVHGEFEDGATKSDLRVVFSLIEYFDGEESVKIVTAFRPDTLTG